MNKLFFYSSTSCVLLSACNIRPIDVDPQGLAATSTETGAFDDEGWSHSDADGGDDRSGDEGRDSGSSRTGSGDGDPTREGGEASGDGEEGGIEDEGDAEWSEGGEGGWGDDWGEGGWEGLDEWGEDGWEYGEGGYYDEGGWEYGEGGYYGEEGGYYDEGGDYGEGGDEGEPPGNECPTDELPAGLPIEVYGNTSDNESSFRTACGYNSSRSPDSSYLFKAPSSGYFRISVFSPFFDTVLALFGANCSENELMCNDDYHYWDEDSGREISSSLVVGMDANEEITIVVDGFDGDWGERYRLNINEVDFTCPDHTITPGTDELPYSYQGKFSNNGEGVLSASCAYEAVPETTHLFTAPEKSTYLVEAETSQGWIILYAQDKCAGRELDCSTGSYPDESSANLLLDLDKGENALIAIEAGEAYEREDIEYSLRIRKVDG